MQRKIRVLVGKPGLDGHDRGAKVVAAALRDAGMEVIYTGLHQTPEQIVEAAVQEDVDVVALSVLSGAHMTLFPEIHRLMRERGIGDKLLTGGGIIPADDMNALLAQGVGRLFGPGSSTVDIIAYIREWYGERFGVDALPPLPPPPARPEPVMGSGAFPSPSLAAGHLDAHHARGARRAAPAAKPPARRKVKPAKKKAAAKPARKAAKAPARKPAKAARKVAKAPARKPARKVAKKAAKRTSAGRGARRR
jgi:methylmalonyl-CoA mutase C-terminal domain/subunit